MKVLACVAQPSDEQCDASLCFTAVSSIVSLASGTIAAGVEIKVLSNPSLSELKVALKEIKPNLLYLAGATTLKEEAKTGALQPFVFKGGETASDVLVDVLKGQGVSTLYIDAKFDAAQAQALQSSQEVPNVIAWDLEGAIPASIAGQCAHCFFTTLLSYSATPHEAFAISSHVARTYFSTRGGDGVTHPVLPIMLSAEKPALPDNTSIPKVAELPGMDISQGVVALAGWSDLRLLAPRAELRLLLCGGPSLIDSVRLSYLGEALRSLLVLEMRSAKLLSSSASTKVPANLPAGCTALRCEVETASGRMASVVLGGQPDVLKESSLVEYALRMTLVSDSLSLQFRLPPPGVDIPAPRCSPAIAGGAPVVDTVCLSSVWAVQVLRSLSQDAVQKGMLSVGVAAVGGSASVGVTPLETQRLFILSTGEYPSPKPEAVSPGGKEEEDVPEDETEDGAPPAAPPAAPGRPENGVHESTKDGDQDHGGSAPDAHPTLTTGAGPGPGPEEGDGGVAMLGGSGVAGTCSGLPFDSADAAQHSAHEGGRWLTSGGVEGFASEGRVQEFGVDGNRRSYTSGSVAERTPATVMEGSRLSKRMRQ